MFSSIDASSNAGNLNESPLADKFGSIKNSLVYLHNQQTIIGNFPEFLLIPILSLPSGLITYFYVVACSHNKLEVTDKPVFHTNLWDSVAYDWKRAELDDSNS